LAGAFGTSLKETRLTALLGYLVALNPDPFAKVFGFSGRVKEVILEERQEQGRADIVIETTRGRGLIEAKVDSTDAFRQASAYRASWKILITQYFAPSHRMNVTGAHYLRWQQVADWLKGIRPQRHRAEFHFVRDDLLKHLEEHNMTRNAESVEIYAREINEPFSLNLFLKAHLYVCWYKDSDRLARALYFAPHFGKFIGSVHPGIQPGISYVAHIKAVQTLEAWNDVAATLTETRGRGWLATQRKLLSEMKGWNWRGERYTMLLLGKPRLVFNPPIKKANLQNQPGILVKRFHAFDELFAAWGK
jgi:hypothetical protein